MSSLALISDTDFSREKIELIKRTIAVGASDDELQLFLYTCKRTGLDPLARQIYAIKRSGKMTIQTGIDGYRLIADRTNRLAGISDYIFDATEEAKFPQKATVTVKKILEGGFVADFTATARWGEYNAGSPIWQKMPFLMLGKCAEALALRKAFPADLSGVYTAEEMAQADNQAQGEAVHAEVARQMGSGLREAVPEAVVGGQPSSVGVSDLLPPDLDRQIQEAGKERIGARTAHPGSYMPVPPELDWSYNKSSGVLICRIVDAKLAKKKAGGAEYVALKLNRAIDGKDAATYFHETHKATLLAAKGKIVKLMVQQSKSGYVNVDDVLEVDGVAILKPVDSPEIQARLLASMLEMTEEGLMTMHTKWCDGQWPLTLQKLKDEQQARYLAAGEGSND